MAKLFLLTLAVCAGGVTLLAPLNSVAEVLGPRAASGESPYVILLRHGDAPGRSEPLDFVLGDCSTQRNLSDKGRNEAREVGETLRARAINVTKVLASRWCRTQETAKLLGLGPVEDQSDFDNLDFNKTRAATLIDRERELIASWHGPGVLLIVTHSSNIKALTGLAVEQGTMIVARPSHENNMVLFGKISLRSASPS